jgi:hypothetical protein
MVLIQLAKEFGIKVVANHCMDVHRESVFAVLKAASIPIAYGLLDSFPYKVELKHENWRNVELCCSESIMSRSFFYLPFYLSSYSSFLPCQKD